MAADLIFLRDVIIAPPANVLMENEKGLKIWDLHTFSRDILTFAVLYLSL